MPNSNSKLPSRRVSVDDANTKTTIAKPRLSQKSTSFHSGGIPASAASSSGFAVSSASSAAASSQGQLCQKHQHHMTALRRLKTEPSGLPSLAMLQAASASTSPSGRQTKLTKLLLNVTIQGSLGPVHVVMSPESTVEDLIAASVRQYVKEGRRPFLASSVPSGFDLHYSQFSLESKPVNWSISLDHIRSKFESIHIYIYISIEVIFAGLNSGLKREEQLANLGSRNFFLCKRSRRSTADQDGNEGDGGGRVKSCSKEAEETKVGLPWLKFMSFLQ
ncbi:hypothetical protein Dimus_009425 [Dionaea muscipula]